MTQTSVAAPDARIICALDVPTTDEAAALVERIGDAVGFYKTVSYTHLTLPTKRIV